MPVSAGATSAGRRPRVSSADARPGFRLDGIGHRFGTAYWLVDPSWARSGRRGSPGVDHRALRRQLVGLVDLAREGRRRQPGRVPLSRRAAKNPYIVRQEVRGRVPPGVPGPVQSRDCFCYRVDRPDAACLAAGHFRWQAWGHRPATVNRSQRVTGDSRWRCPHLGSAALFFLLVVSIGDHGARACFSQRDGSHGPPVASPLRHQAPCWAGRRRGGSRLSE